MEPAPTFVEIARILRSGGVFGAYEYAQLPTVNPTIDTALLRFFDRTKRIGVDEKAAESVVQTIDPVKQRWKSAGHLERLQASGHFRYGKEVGLHQWGNRQRPTYGQLLSLPGWRKSPTGGWPGGNSCRTRGIGDGIGSNHCW
jgi:hypothetical protein